jgi:hypothetical protein
MFSARSKIGCRATATEAGLATGSDWAAIGFADITWMIGRRGPSLDPLTSLSLRVPGRFPDPS